MPNIVRFDTFEVDLDVGQLRKGGTRIKLRDQSFQVLASLLERPGEVVTREELRWRLWRDQTFVDFDNNLNIIVARLREALGDQTEQPRFIETLPKRGYRFVAALSDSLPGGNVVKGQPERMIVLPFLNVSGDPKQEYFSDAVTDEIITEVASLAPQRLAVIARTTAMTYKARPKDVAAIRRELGVAYVLEGSVRRTEDAIAINVQLVHTKDQTHLFAKRYSGTPHDIFNLESRIAKELAAYIPGIADLARTGGMPTAPVGRRATADLGAYNEYIQGRYHLSKATVESVASAKQHLERAIALDPEFAPAHDALAEVYWYMGYTGAVSPRQAFCAGIAHALHAIEIDNTRAETHALLGEFHKTLEYNWPEVRREMALALKLGSNSPVVRMRYAVSELMPHARLDEAVAELERALQLDPLSLLNRTWLGIVLVLGRRYQRAIEEAQELINLDPSYYLGYFILGHGYRYQGRFQEAVAAQRKAVELSRESAMMLGWLGLSLAVSGETGEARAVLQKLHAMASRGYVPPTSFAWIHLGLKEIDTAFEWLDRAVDECDQLIMPIKSYAFLDPIRSDPRFPMLLRRMRLEP